ncbi:hypothetical protein HME9304_02739 [Flagellimonas maritima]|uniref:Uncharacterized protein n=1 Tax=Flagellimonas maritima TaxID=1383885 RepID=A0A2Z4LVC6_9FLAO|nr:hypothetical protein [Allomuricauda aurantiaca]AWX45712.1 hypothetical protein HME9304_02739 [Allomuricauda aurantiaca]
MKGKKIFLKILVVMGILLLAPIGLYLYFTGGKGAYKVGGGLGYSRTIKESKDRGVFMYELDYQIDPDTIKINEGVTFFIEKGFRYGEWRASDTDSLRGDENFKYQTNTDFKGINNVYIGKYRSVGGGNRFIEIPDTIYRGIYTLRSPPHDSIYEVGELKLFKKKE